jgi:tape measure domain-containing protein
MASPGSLSLKLIIDGSNTGAIRALTQVATEAAKTGGGLSRLDAAAGNFGKTRAGLESISTQLSRIQQAVAAFGGIAIGASGLGDLQRLSDEYTSVNSRLKLASTSSNDFKAAQQGIFEIAQRNGQALAATGTFYGRIADSVRRMGKNSADALGATEAVAASLKISGATTAEAASAQLQFAQALASGTLRGDELNSVLEASPRLAKALAEGLRVPQGELKKLGEEGKLTSQAILEALLSQKEALVGEATSMELTIGQSLTNVRNAFTKTFGERTAGGASALAGSINGIATSLGSLLDVATVAGAALLAVFGTRMLTAIAAQIAAKQALIVAERTAAAAAVATAEANVAAAAGQARHTLSTEALTAAKLQLAAAERASVVAATGVAVRGGGALLGLLGGPIGAIATALTVGITAWQVWGNKGEEATAKVGQSLADLTKELKDFGATLPEAERIKKYEALAEAIRKAREEEQKLRAATRQAILDNAARDDTAVITDASLKSAVDNDANVKQASEARIAAEKTLQEELTAINKKATNERAFLVKSLVEKQKALNGELLIDEKKALEQRVADHVKAATAVRDAWQKTMAEAKAKRDEATAAPGKTADLADSLKARVDTVKMASLSDEDKQAVQAQQAIQAGQDALDARTRASFELTKGYTQQLRGDVGQAKKSFDAAEKDLNKAFSQAEKAGDTGLMDEVAGRLTDVSAARGKIASKEADQLDQQAEAQRSKMLELDTQATDLKNKLAGMEVDVKIDGAVAKIAQLDAAAEALKSKLAGLGGVANQASPVAAADINSAGLGGFAYGGLLPGSAPHDRADNRLYWGTPGEWVIQRPAVRHYGAAFIAAVNAMKLPKFATGGQIGGSTIDRLRIPSLSSASGNGSSLAPANFYLDGQRYPMQGSPDVLGQLASHFSREALRKGGRR